MKVQLKPDYPARNIPCGGKIYHVSPDKETDVPDAVIAMLGDAVLTTAPEPEQPKKKTKKQPEIVEPVEVIDNEL